MIIPILISYLIGSIPTSYIFGKILKGIDIREHGSGNVGATNTFRVVGKVPGVTALLIDIFKGYICVTFIASIFMHISPQASPEFFKIILGVSAILGHNWTIFLKFKGGKGVAVSAGVLIGLMPKILLLGFLVWMLVFLITRYVSLASIIAAILIPFFALVSNKSVELIILSAILCIVIVYKHRPNIKRLCEGKEKRMAHKA